MSAEEFTPEELEVIGLLGSNDPTAAEKLVELSEAHRARVLAYVTGMTGADDPSVDEDDEGSGEPPISQPEPPVAGESLPDPEVPVGVRSRSRAARSKVVLVGLGVVLLGLLGFLLRGCGDDGGHESRSLLLVRESSSDLYIVGVGEEVGRANRAVRDIISLRHIDVTKGGLSWESRFAALGGQRVIVARTQDGESAWIVDGDDYGQVIESEDGTVTAVVVDETLYVKEESEGAQRCYRGSSDDLELVFRRDYCELTRSGHMLTADQSEEWYRVSVVSPEGREMLEGRFPTRPVISDNGLFLMVVDEDRIIVIGVETGDRVWELEGGVAYDFASHRNGYLAILAQAADGGLVLAVVDSDGNADDLTEVVAGAVVAEFTDSGDLFWIEPSGDGDSILLAWDSSERDVIELADGEDLDLLVGVYEDSVVTATEDDFGVLFQRFSLDGSVSELHEFEDESGLQGVLLEGDYVYAIGSELASVISLSEGEAVDSEPWDGITFLDYHESSLVLAGTDGSSEVLFLIDARSANDVEYGLYDEIASAQIYGDTLYASVMDGSRVDTLAFDLPSGDQRDEDYGGYRLVSSRVRIPRDVLSSFSFR